jgi:hypothetical protein
MKKLFAIAIMLCSVLSCFAQYGSGQGSYGTIGNSVAHASTAGVATTLAPHLGFVASGTRINDTFNNGGNTNWMQRSYHIATSPITNIEVAFANFYYTEENSGAPAYITATVEYPSNNFTRLTFGGAGYTNIPAGQYAMSDLVVPSPPIPEGAMFWIRTFYFCTNGIIYTPFSNTNYNRATFGTSSVTDLTGGGTIPQQNTFIMFPLAIIGSTTKPSILGIGDSRMVGRGDFEKTTLYGIDPNPLFGGFSRLIDGEHYGFCDLGVTGDYYTQFITEDAQRMSFTNYATAVVFQYGINDIYTANEINIVTNASNFATNVCRTLPVYASTLEPYTTSSDLWETLSNQTVKSSGGEATRVAYNQALRNNLANGIRGYLEMAAPVESSSNSGLWAVTGFTNDAAFCTDGLHASTTGCRMQAASIPDFFDSGKAMALVAGSAYLPPVGATFYNVEIPTNSLLTHGVQGYFNNGIFVQTGIF